MTTSEKPRPDTCTWTRDEFGDGIWSTSCNVTDWVFDEGGPKENKMRFCPFCGKRLRQHTPRQL